MTRRARLATVEHRHLHIPPAVLGVDLARVDLQPAIPRGVGERLGGRPGCVAQASPLGGGMAEQADGIVVEVPAGDLVQGDLSLLEGALHPQEAGHASRPASDVAVQAQDAVGPEVARPAGGAGEVAAAKRDRANGRQNRPRVRAFGMAGVRLGAGAGGPPFCSAPAIRPCKAAARVERSKARP